MFEKVNKPLRKSYPVLRLYKDDIEELVHIFEQNGEKVTIEVGDYKLKAVEDIEHLGVPTITDFSLQLVNDNDFAQEKTMRYTYISLDLRHNSATIYLSNENDTHLLGVTTQLDSFLKKKRGYLSYITTFWVTGALILLVMLGFVLFVPLSVVAVVFGLNWLLVITPLLLPVVFAASVAMYLGWVVYTLVKRYVVIFTTNRKATPGFWTRNKDQIVVGIISAIVGGIFVEGLNIAFSLFNR